MPTLVLTALVVATAGCASTWSSSEALSYAQVRSIQQGQSADEIESLLGAPQERGRALVYPAENPDGKVLELRIDLDEDGRVISWTLGQINRAQ